MDATAALAGHSEVQDGPGAGAGDASHPDLRALPPADQRQLILAELGAGRSDLEIGARFALSQWQVRNLRYRLGLKKGRGGRPPHATSPQGPAPHTAARLAADARHMAFRLVGRFPGPEAGRRLAALGALLAASEGVFDLRVACHEPERTGPR